MYHEVFLSSTQSNAANLIIEAASFKRDKEQKKATSHRGSWLCSCNNANQSEVLGLVTAERSRAVGCHHRDRLGRYCRENANMEVLWIH